MGDCSMHITKIAPFPRHYSTQCLGRVLLVAGDEGFEPPQTESESGDNCFCSVNLVKMCHFCLKHYVCGDLHRSLFLLISAFTDK